MVRGNDTFAIPWVLYHEAAIYTAYMLHGVGYSRDLGLRRRALL
jgi:hypothetical protein